MNKMFKSVATVGILLALGCVAIIGSTSVGGVCKPWQKGRLLAGYIGETSVKHLLPPR